VLIFKLNFCPAPCTRPLPAVFPTPLQFFPQLCSSGRQIAL
jgi:hypothetical protein